MRVRLSALAALVTACGASGAPAPARAPAAAPAPAPAPSPSPSPSPPASAPGPAAAAASPPPSADPELLSLATSLCAAAYRVRDDGKVDVGCRRPPPFDAPGKEPDGKVLLHQGDPTTFCGISVQHRGTFTKTTPGATQVVVSIENCRDEDDSAAWNGSMSGSAALLESAAPAAPGKPAWRAVAVTGGVNLGDCKQARIPAGRDVLLCRSRYDAGTIGTMTYFFSLDFARVDRPARTAAYLYDDSEMFLCGSRVGPDVIAPTGLAKLRIAGVSLSDVNRDGTPDLVVDVERSFATPSKALEDRIRASCTQSGELGPVFPKPTRSRLEIVSNGGRFVPTKATRALLDRWRAESPDVTQLEPTAPPPESP